MPREREPAAGRPIGKARSQPLGGQQRLQPPGRREISRPARACRRKFLRLFPDGFRDDDYVALEREYKWATHVDWEETLSRTEFRRLLRDERHEEIAGRAVRVEQRARHSMMFSFEKMALRDAVRSARGAR